MGDSLQLTGVSGRSGSLPSSFLLDCKGTETDIGIDFQASPGTEACDQGGRTLGQSGPATGYPARYGRLGKHRQPQTACQFDGLSLQGSLGAAPPEDLLERCLLPGQRNLEQAKPADRSEGDTRRLAEGFARQGHNRRSFMCDPGQVNHHQPPPALEPDQSCGLLKTLAIGKRPALAGIAPGRRRKIYIDGDEGAGSLNRQAKARGGEFTPFAQRLLLGIEARPYRGHTGRDLKAWGQKAKRLTQVRSFLQQPRRSGGLAKATYNRALGFTGLGPDPNLNPLAYIEDVLSVEGKKGMGQATANIHECPRKPSLDGDDPGHGTGPEAQARQVTLAMDQKALEPAIPDKHTPLFTRGVVKEEFKLIPHARADHGFQPTPLRRFTVSWSGNPMTAG